MDGISEMMLGGRQVSRLSVGEGVVYAQGGAGAGARYAYYFNGVDSACGFNTLFFNQGRGASVFGIDFVSLKVDECFCNGWGVWFLSISDTIKLRATNSSDIIRVPNPGMRVRVLVECDDANNYAMTVNDGEPVRVESDLQARVNFIGWAKIGSIKTWGGYVFGVNIGGEWITLEELPGVNFTNVTRYELGADGLPIMSTATILNT